MSSSSYLRAKSICQFGRTMNNSPWSKAEKWQIRAPTKFWIWLHHLKGLFLSFQKNIKLDQRNSSYGCWKMFNSTPPPARNLIISMVRGLFILEFRWPNVKNFTFFWKLRKRPFKWCHQVHIWELKVFVNLAVPWIIAHGPRPKNDKLGPWRSIEFLTHH